MFETKSDIFLLQNIFLFVATNLRHGKFLEVATLVMFVLDDIDGRVGGKIGVFNRPFDVRRSRSFLLFTRDCR